MSVKPQSKNLRWYFHRLKAMGPTEVALRVRAALRQRSVDAALQALQATERLLGEPKNFPKLPDPLACPIDIREFVVQEAQDIMQGSWTILHGHQITVGFPPVWHRDYLSGGQLVELKPARELNYRQQPNVDARIVWELSRWVQAVRVAQAAYLGLDGPAVEYVLGLLEDWLQHNPVGRGLNWTSPMEPGLRLINFTWIDALLRGVDLTADQAARLDVLAQEIVPAHVWWVQRHQSFGSSANNHLLGELCGLMVAQARWSAAASWSTPMSALAHKMEKELLRQFASDGGNREQALHYHLFAWELGWQGLHAAKGAGITPSAHATTRLQGAAQFFCAMAEHEESWDFGDSDDAHITPFYGKTSTALAEWVAWLNGGTDSGFAYWLGSFSASPQPDLNHWNLFPESGYAVTAPEDWHLRVDASALGFGSIAAHGHLDALHLSLWKNHHAIIVDPGTGSYFNEDAIREHFVSRQAHNGPHFAEDKLYPPRYGSFLWGRPHAVPKLELVDGALHVSSKLGSNRIERSIQRQESGWDITDTISAVAADFAIHWQFAPGLLVETTSGGYLVVGVREAFEFAIGADADIKTELIQPSEENGMVGLCSPYYKRLNRSAVIRVSGHCTKQMTVRTKLRTTLLH